MSLPGIKVPPYSRDLRTCANKATTRCQLAVLNLPLVFNIQDDEIELVIDPRHLSNPLVLGRRPSESTVRKCQQLLSQARDEDDEPNVALKVGYLGVFNRHSLEIW